MTQTTFAPVASGPLAALDLLRISISGPVVHLRLMRPEKRNAISDPLIRQIHTAFVNLPAGTRAAVISGDASDTGHLLAEGYDYALMLNPGTGAVSLRGTGKVNLAALAERYGGGGHPNAAGFVPRRLSEHYARFFEAILGDEGGAEGPEGSEPAGSAPAARAGDGGR